MVNNEKMMELLKAGKLADLEKALQENIRENAYKTAGKKSGYASIIKRMIKNTEKAYLKPGVHKFNYNNITYEALTDGHYILASSNTFNIKECEKPLDLSRIIKDVDLNNDFTIKIDLDNIRAFSKLNKDATKPYIIDFDGGYIGVNPKFLIDILDFTGSDEIIINKNLIKNNTYKYMIYNVPIWLSSLISNINMCVCVVGLTTVVSLLHGDQICSDLRKYPPSHPLHSVSLSLRS